MTDPAFDSFGDLLKYLRRRARLTQKDLSIATGYSESYISRLEKNQRLPDTAAVAALFVPALELEEEPETAAQLRRLAMAARGEPLPGSDKFTLTQPVTHKITETIEAIDILPKHNLPPQFTSFIGRDAELAEVERILTQIQDAHSLATTPRLVTLTGAGGSGKTRLAIHTAANLLNTFPDGVWWVELAPLADSALVTQTIANLFGVRERPEQTLLAALSDAVRDKSILFVLDNCEHLVAACSQVAETLLRAGQNVRILATSRETLNIPGERVLPVPPLSTPDPHHPLPLAALEQYEAVSLFIERANATLPGFALTKNNALAVAQICYQLDGIPLALELAAARLKLMQVEELAARLADGFQLLTGGSRTALPRHQTLHALIDWSYNLLSVPERVLLQRLAVFAGGWTLKAVEAVCGGDWKLETGEFSRPESANFIVESLTQLVNKSLVVAERKPGVAARFQLLGTIRQYALEKLDESGEAGQVRQQHLVYYLGLAEEAEPALRGKGQVEWLARLNCEHDNLRAVLSFSLESGNVEAAMRLAGALFRFWHIQGYVSEGRRWLSSVLAIEGNMRTLLRTSGRAKALLGSGVLAYSQGDYTAAQASLEESLSIYREVGEKFGEGYALYTLAAISFQQGSYSSAHSKYEESLAVYQTAGNAWGVGNCVYGLGFLALLEGNSETARQCFEESVTILRQVGDKWSLTRPLNYLAWEVWFQGDVAKARSLHEENLSAHRVLGVRSGIANTLSSMAVMAAVHGEYATSRSLEEEALSIARTMGNKSYLAYSLERLGEIAYRQGNLGEARVQYTESMRLFQEMNDTGSIGLLLRDLGRLAYHEGAYQQSAAFLEESRALLEQVGAKHLLNYTLLALGEVTRLQGDYERAAEFYRQSLKLHRERGIVLEVADRIEGLAKVAVMQEQTKRAAQLMGAADALREQLGTPLQPVDRDDYERHLAAIQGALGETTFAAAWASGRLMTVEQVVAFALTYSSTAPFFIT